LALSTDTVTGPPGRSPAAAAPAAPARLQRNGVVVLTGKSFGSTNLIALDGAGTLLAESLAVPSGRRTTLALSTDTVTGPPGRSPAAAAPAAPVSLQRNGVVVLTGKSFGSTNLIALDGAGTLLAESVLRCPACPLTSVKYFAASPSCTAGRQAGVHE
jgi:hypothetical protein